jgi:choline-sulfatase
LLPTICDYAGLAPPQDVSGISLKPLIDGKQGNNRDFVVVETKFADFHSYKTMGRSVVGDRFKYVVYSWGKNREQLFDLKTDPGEMHNLIDDDTYSQTLNTFRDYLYRWCVETNDKQFLRKLILSDNSSVQLFDKPY